MAEQPPIDPLAAMHALIAAWNRGQAGGAAPAAPLAPAAPHDGAALAEITRRLDRIEETLLRIEAQAARREARDAAKAERRDAAKAERRCAKSKR